MTSKQLREWLFQNSQVDQWWLSLDAVTEDCVVTINEIEERLKSGMYGQAQVLHVSQTELPNSPWTEVFLSEPTPQRMTPRAPSSVVSPLASPLLGATKHRTETKEPKESSSSAGGVLGLLLLVCGLGSLVFFLLFFDTSVDAGSMRVNNLGSMNDKQNGIIVGGILAVVGVLLGIAKKK